MTNPEGALFLDTVTGPDTLAAIQQILDNAWATHRVPETVRMHMDLAAGEICANIIEHAGDGRPVRLRMAVSVTPDAVVTTFTDDGRFAAVDLSNLQLPEDMSERGRGLAMAHRVLDGLTYHRDDGGNHWRLVHRLVN